MACVSGIGKLITQIQYAPLIFLTACVVGSSIICVDLLVQRIPGKRNFKIQDSNSFLSASLSLTFGVMVSKVSICFSLGSLIVDITAIALLFII